MPQASTDDMLREMAVATLSHYDKENISQIKQHNALMRYMETHGGITSDISSGKDIAIPVTLRENSTITNFQNYDELNTGKDETSDMAYYFWSEKAGHISASGRELLLNSGKEAIFSLIKTRARTFRESAYNRTAVEVYSNGTISKGLTGVLGMITQTGQGTVGKIDGNTNVNWRNQAMLAGANGSVTASNIKGFLNKARIDTDLAGDNADLMVMTNDFYAALQDAAQLNQRFVSDRYGNKKATDMGFDNFDFNGAAVIHDVNSSFAANLGQCLIFNTQYFGLNEHPSAKWTETSMPTPARQNAHYVRFIWMGAFWMSKRRPQGIVFTN